MIAGGPLARDSGAARDPGYTSVPVVVEGTTIAELHVWPAQQFSSQLDVAFDRNQRRSIYWSVGLLLVLAWVVSWILARQFTKPIRSLASGTQAIINGNYDRPIAIASNDELGALATDVNSLARVLWANRESRRRWLGDINHELRTPLTILTAELQSLEDGFRPFDNTSVASLQNEVDRLSRLVDDLYSLSASDEGNLEYRFDEFDVISLLRERLDGVSARLVSSGLKLVTQLPDEPLSITADSTRIGQLFTNLIENAISYTDSPGTISVTVSSVAESLRLTIEDSAPGVPKELHARIFERLYRLDSSRNRRSGAAVWAYRSVRRLSRLTAVKSAHARLSLVVWRSISNYLLVKPVSQTSGAV